MPKARSTLRWFRLGSVPLVALATIWLAWYLLVPATQHHVIVGAGARTGDSYRFCEALRRLMVEHGSSIDLELRETAGTHENLALLEAREIDLATVQADIPASASARWVATLFPDAFLLLARHGSGISGVADLRGRRVAVPPIGGGQRMSFEFVLAHYGLGPQD